MTIYAYSTETYLKKGWIKAGETTTSADERIAQQDGTSNPEPLIKLQEWPVDISDRVVHANLEKMGKKRVRFDKQREWFQCSVEDVAKAVNDAVYGVQRPNSYHPRDEQQECVDKAIKHFKTGNEFLVNAKMRFGKTFVSYLIAKEMQAKSVLVLTYKPAVKDGWKNDLNDHVYFDGWEYSSGEGFKLDTNADVNVIFASFQDINDFNKEKWTGILEHQFDLVVIDEMHYGSDTDRAKLTLSNINTNKTLFVSGTPLDALISGRFAEDNTYTWSYADEQTKRRAEKENGWSTDVYRWLPEMEIHTFQVSDEAKKQTLMYNDEEQFTMTKMFGTDDGQVFNDEASVKLFLDQVFGRGVRKLKSPFRTFAPDHSLWVLPPNVKSVTAMCNLLEKLVGDEYQIINVAGNNVTSLSKVQKTISHFTKTITVTAGRFNTGVTVPEWDAVLMMNDGKAPESYFQTIFRAQSTDKARKKEKCYVMDFQPERLLELVYTYAELTAKSSDTISGNIRSFLEFAPIIDHSDNKLQRVSTEDVVSFVSEVGDFISKFESNYLFNTDNVSGLGELLNIDGSITSANARLGVTTNNLETGKNYQSQTQPSQKTPTQKKEEQIMVEKAKVVVSRIPEYKYLIEDISRCEDLLTADPLIFEDHFEITVDTFTKMYDNAFINVGRLNRLIESL